MNKIAAIADDTTGALEIGALLASERIPTEVRLHGGEVGSTVAAVIDTDTRHAEPSDAFARVLETVRNAPLAAALFKKTDSTLRGQIGAEIAAICSARPDQHVVYVPAYPGAGRTVVDGILRVWGVPVEQTEFAADPRSPVRRSSVLGILASAGVRATLVKDAASLRDALGDRLMRVIVCDGAEEADLARVAECVRDRCDVILAGPGGIARFWARFLDCERTEIRRMPTVEGWLVVCGSMHPVSRRQLAAARRVGIRSLASPGELCQADAITPVVHKTAAALRSGEAQGVIVFGGETARAVLLELGCSRLSALAELIPGVPLSLAHADGLEFPIVTKAGGFGGENLVECILARLSR